MNETKVTGDVSLLTLALYQVDGVSRDKGFWRKVESAKASEQVERIGSSGVRERAVNPVEWITC